MQEQLHIVGTYHFTCYRPDGSIRWAEIAGNTVVTVGKNELLNQALAGSAFTVTGPFMFLISSTGWSAVNATDTMASHPNFLEAGNANTPTYSGTRKTCVWSAASAGSKALSAGLAFSITGTGTLKGGGLVFGAGAVNTIDDTNGILFSAAVFASGDRLVHNLDVVTVTYSLAV